MDAYDIVVIGGGSGSQVATAATDRGLEAAVIERGPLGGACITRGCVPSKALIHRADVVDEIRGAAKTGIDAEVNDVDYGEITSAIRETVYGKADRQERSLREREHVTLYRGEGRFVDDRTVAVDLEEEATDRGGDKTNGGGETVELRGESVVVAVGSRPTVPPIDGIEDADYLTSDDALFLEERPDSLVIVGGGYIGAELGYFFGAMGTDVSLVGRSDRLVPREDHEVSDAVTESLERYCDVYTGHEATRVSGGDGGVGVEVESADNEAIELEGERLLIATGRRPNTDTLSLEETGIETDDAGHLEVDDRLETGVDGVWALGDVVGTQPYKHAADYEAEIVSANLLEESEVGDVGGDAERTVDYDAMPHAIFTKPQVASVGRTSGELEDNEREYESTTVSFDAAPLGMILETDGFVKVLAAPDGEILGCHIVGPQASTLIQEVVVAMERGSGTVDDVAGSVHVHPALSEAVYAAFDDLSSRPFSTAPDWRDVAD
ncbi:dihydrolipoyl dehydrogenase [Natrarchaeobius sp. A-rgal3]|uniref:dihydrolipoyl dehydrogenase n=1 Tax=Natrarchaeobius versutus TaxID=1679078 RepID=UPI00350ED5B1